jgi:hypothetical protein
MWEIVPQLAEEGILNNEDLQSIKNGFLSLLESNNKRTRNGLLFVLPGIIKSQLLKSNEIDEIIYKLWHGKDESEQGLALAALSSMFYSHSELRYESMMVVRRFVLQLITSPNMKDSIYGWNLMPMLIESSRVQRDKETKEGADDQISDREISNLELILSDMENAFLHLLTNTNISKEMGILVQMCFLYPFTSLLSRLDSTTSDTLNIFLAKGLFSNRIEIQRFFVILMGYIINKELGQDLEKFDGNEIKNFLEELISKTSIENINSKTILALSDKIKDEVVTTKELRQLKEEYFNMLGNPNLDNMLQGLALSLISNIRVQEIINREEAQRLFSKNSP